MSSDVLETFSFVYVTHTVCVISLSFEVWLLYALNSDSSFHCFTKKVYLNSVKS